MLNSSLEKGPVFATRFSPTGQYLLTASIDGTVCVWDVPNKTLHKQYQDHLSEHSSLLLDELRLILVQVFALMSNGCPKMSSSAVA